MAVSPEEFGFTSQYFDLPGVRLHAATHGDRHAPLLVLLHGFPEGWLSFRQQIGPLAAAGYRVVAPDQRGYHLTSKRGPYDLNTLTHDALRLMDACGASHAHWVGHDWGGVVAWKLAERFPQHVATLTILNVPHPAIGVRSVMRGNLRQLVRSAYIYFFQIPWVPEWLLRRRDSALMRRSMATSARPGTFGPADLDRYVRLWSEPGALAAMLAWYRAFMRGVLRRGWPALPLPPPYRMPALLLWGEQDVALGVELAEQSARLLENGRLVRLPAATHWVQHDFPAVVTQHLLAHLASAA
jgi:pimeloyl-ACP methyl ester carboxylesterase